VWIGFGNALQERSGVYFCLILSRATAGNGRVVGVTNGEVPGYHGWSVSVSRAVSGQNLLSGIWMTVHLFRNANAIAWSR
jgi:hypothetical protein